MRPRLRRPRPAQGAHLCPGLVLAAWLVWPAAPAVGATDDPVASLRRVREAMDAQEPERALERLAPLAGGPLAAHAALLRARLQRDVGRLDEALVAARAGLELRPPSQLRSALSHEVARLELQRGQLADAYRAQRAAWEASGDSDHAASLAIELAAELEKAGLPGDALLLYRRVWARWPLAEASTRAYARSQELARATGAPPPAVDDLLERAHRLRRRYRCDQGLPLYDAVLGRVGELEADDQSGARRGRAACLFSRRRYEEAAEAYRELAGDDPRRNFEEAIRVGRAYARMGQDARALQEFAAIRARVGPAGQARCDYLSAIVVRTAQPARYQELMRRVEKGANQGLAHLARWRLAWIELRNQRPEAALPYLEQLTRGSVWDIEVQRARYWRAVALRPSQPERAAELLRQLSEAVPLSYYGIIAAEQLDPAPPRERAFVGSAPQTELGQPAIRTGWLIDGGHPELALLELDSWLAEGSLGRSERLQAARLLHSLDDHFRAVRLIVDGFGDALERGVDPTWRAAWELAWPRPFEPLVSSASGEFAFDPSLVYAVMREESTYRPAVESPAGAIGLMQIIPPTAQDIAGELGVAGFEPSGLKDPSTNIRFGTYYLKSLLEHFDGSLPFAIAAYNAGPDAVGRWLSQDGRLPLDTFVDSVPYGETRRYLRKVLRSQQVYRLLYGQEPSADQPQRNASRSVPR